MRTFIIVIFSLVVTTSIWSCQKTKANEPQVENCQHLHDEIAELKQEIANLKSTTSQTAVATTTSDQTATSTSKPTINPADCECMGTEKSIDWSKQETCIQVNGKNTGKECCVRITAKSKKYIYKPE